MFDEFARDEEFDFVVIGAGIAGLAFALQALETGKTVLILEKDRQIGGLNRTLDYKGFKFDYSAHRFHSANPEVMNKVKEVMGPTFERYVQRSRIRMFGRYLKYPFQLQNLLRAMPLHQSFLSGVDFMRSLVGRNFHRGEPKRFSNYKEWFVYHFGERLYKVMCEPYTSKIWKTRPELISADWADQRFQGVNIQKLIGNVIRKTVKLDFSSYSLEDENLAPDGGEFYYAPLGAQEMADRYAGRVRSLGGKISVLSKVVEIDAAEKLVTTTSGKRARYSRAVISTMPLHDLYKAVRKKDAGVETALSQLKYMNIIFVYLLLDKDRVSADHWLYFADDDIIFNRSVEFKTWSKQMAPEGKTALCLDITCFQGDETWAMGKEQIIARSIDGAVMAELIKPADITDTLVVRVKDAYPFYDLDYKPKLEKIVSHLESSGDLFCLGRTGIFRYNNSDGSVEMGMQLAKNLSNDSWTKGNRAGLLEYEFEHISY